MEEFDQVWRTQQHYMHLHLTKTLSPSFFLLLTVPCSNTRKRSHFRKPYAHYHFPTTMAEGIDMSLDDLIKRSSAVSRSRYDGPGPHRRFTDRKPDRTTPYSIPQARQVRQQNTVSEKVLRDDGAAKTDKATKLYISNLDYGVSNGDIKLLFSEVGELKRYGIHYDKSGRSKGTAEVTFARQSDALAAIRRYKNVKLDGKRLQIELVGSLVTPAVVPLGQNSLLGRPNDDVLVSEQGRVGGSRFHDDFRQNRFPKGHRDLDHDFERYHPIHRRHRDRDHDFERYHRIPGGNAQVKSHIGRLNVKDLDDDLERYHLEAKQINNNNKDGN